MFAEEFKTKVDELLKEVFVVDEERARHMVGAYLLNSVKSFDGNFIRELTNEIMEHKGGSTEYAEELLNKSKTKKDTFNNFESTIKLLSVTEEVIGSAQTIIENYCEKKTNKRDGETFWQVSECL